ncbi:MAG: hypothetical protein LBQ81_12185 [Zoogloeaceae bacterium]|jgi:hypothetical protein|nr:hypothetical protein [Zoogloeaceae bacterium]
MAIRLPAPPVPAPPWNFLAAETGIIARLKSRLQSGSNAWAREVASRDVLATVAEEMQRCPAVYVVYDGFTVQDADEQRALLLHRFLTILAIANAAQGRDAAPRNQSAGMLLPDIVSALHGWQPPECAGGLVPVSAPRPYYSEARFAYFPLAWQTPVIHSTRQGPVMQRHPARNS